jgi:lipoprotein-anchoring transpeptidase ErfK/SrfK
MSDNISTKRNLFPSSSTRKLRVDIPVVPITLIVVLFITLVASSAYCIWVFLQRTDRLYRGHIYPHVFAFGIDLGGMTPQEAEKALLAVVEYVNPGKVAFTNDESKWTYDWIDAGAYVDLPAMVEVAYGVGREKGWRDQLRVWFNFIDVRPLYGLKDKKARILLGELSTEVASPVIQPRIELNNGDVVVVPGSPGIALDIETVLERLRTASRTAYYDEIPLVLQVIEPTKPDTSAVMQQAEQLLQRKLTLTAYDVLTEQTLTWLLDRDEIASWLYLVPGEDGVPEVDVNKHRIRETLFQLREMMGDGRGFRDDEAVQQIWDAFMNEQSSVVLYLTHPARTYSVKAGDTLTQIARRFGIPAGRVAEANAGIDINHLSIGQVINIPSQDIVTPYMPVFWKKIVVNLSEQRVRVYENGVLIWDWITSTGIADSPTASGIFQVIEKEERAYASQWDLWMPYFIGVYNAGGNVVNGFHELPILSNGQRLWAGSLGRPASFGCIILGIPEAEKLYNWVDIGVIVVIE